jgi:hypothetical protein
MPSDTLTFVTAIIGATTGIGSLALSIFNTWNQVRKDDVVRQRGSVMEARIIPPRNLFAVCDNLLS